MKRSEINQLQREAIAFLKKHHFHLPRWAYFRKKDWKKLRRDYQEIKKNHLGWDITDYGQGNFFKLGLVIFTLRNGDLSGKGKPYCEKILIMRAGQKLPIHFHWSKVEDIIVRAGGKVVFEFWNSTARDKLGKKPVSVKVDGILQKLNPGERLVLEPGESVCVPQRIYHRFYPAQGSKMVLIGEVSSVNDDEKDNCFLEPVLRFPVIEEDEESLYPLSWEIP